MSHHLQAHQASARLQQGIGRRSFLKWGLLSGAGVATLAAGGVALLRRSPRDQLPGPSWLSGLSLTEYHLFDRARAVLLPTRGTDLLASDRVPVVKNIQHTVTLMPPGVRNDLATGLSLFDNAAVFFHGKRFVDLSDSLAQAYFDDWGQGVVIQRTLATVIKQLVYSAYWREPDTWQAVEFDGPVTDRWGLAYRGNTPLPTADTETSP